MFAFKVTVAEYNIGFSYRAILSFGLSRLIDWLMPFDRLARAKKTGGGGEGSSEYF